LLRSRQTSWPRLGSC